MTKRLLLIKLIMLQALLSYDFICLHEPEKTGKVEKENRPAPNGTTPVALAGLNFFENQAKKIQRRFMHDSIKAAFVYSLSCKNCISCSFHNLYGSWDS